MKKLIYLLFIVPLFTISAQKIGQLAEEKANIDFPNNALGLDLMIGEGGFGLGGFYRYSLSETMTSFADFSISETKNEREIERYDYFGNPLPILGKKNRIYLLPLNFGVQYRLFSKSLTDNLRPYISASFGPTMFLTSPAQEEFFRSLAYAKVRFGIGGYIGLGANFGNSTTNLAGISVRYSINHLFGTGIEQYINDFKTEFQQISLNINFGFMY